MAIPTVIMGLLPTFAKIGIAASFLIVMLRMFQGIAVGGEFTSSIVFLAENAPQRRRGFFASFSMFGATFGTMLGSAVGGALTLVAEPRETRELGLARGVHVRNRGCGRGVVHAPQHVRRPGEAAGAIAAASSRSASTSARCCACSALNCGTATTYCTLFVYAATWVAADDAGRSGRGAADHDVFDSHVPRRAADRGVRCRIGSAASS